MTGKYITINAVNFTDVFTPTGYTVAYIKRRGNNSGTMMDGSYVDDVITTKAVITCVCLPTDEERMQQLLTICSGQYVTVTYYDPREGNYRTIDAMPSEPSNMFRGQSVNLKQYWTGTAITFTER